MTKAFVTGGAGFIASHLIDHLLDSGTEVVAADIMNRDMAVNLRHLKERDGFSYISMDVSNKKLLTEVIRGSDMVFHMASNSDIRTGCRFPGLDVKDTLQTTISVLESMRSNNITRLFFPSSSTVYGDKNSVLKEDSGDLLPISYYGACKLASESMISAYSYQNDIDAMVFRFPNVVGPRLTHGVIFDLISKLKKDPTRLEILGDGKQRKQYVYVEDLVKGIVDFTSKMGKGVSTYNISTDSLADVKTIADMICKKMNVDPLYEFTGGPSGWKGDVPSFEYDITKAKAAGWTFTYDSVAAIEKTLQELDISSIPSS